MSTELTTIQPQAPALVQLMAQAMGDGKGPEYLRELLAVRREWEADEARKAFNLSIADFQRRAPIVEKGDKAYDKDYARLDRIWRTIRPLLTELGLSITWQTCELRDGMCHVEGQLRHRDGHGERIVQDIPVPELLKGQNKAQQMGSASTYAKRYALCGALGIVTGDDDDGHKAGSDFVTYEQGQELAAMIDACRGLAGFNEGAFWGWVGVASKNAAEIPATRYAEVRAMLQKKLKPQVS
jgi:hypothetical protein